MAETRGRPRSEMSRRAVLEATRDLLRGYDFEWLRASMISVARPQAAALIRGMVALTAARPDHSGAAPQVLLGPGAGALVDRLTAASERGEIRPDADVPALASLLLGSVLLRVLTDARSEEPSAHAAFIVDSLLRGVAQ